MTSFLVPGAVESVHDGDTCRLTLDLGGLAELAAGPDRDLGWDLHVRAGRLVLAREPVRLAHIDAPELSAMDGSGYVARDMLRALLPVGSTVTLNSLGYDKYRRTLGDVQAQDGSDAASELLAAGLARPYEGGKR